MDKEELINEKENNNPWLSPIESERKWQEDHIRKIWTGYPNISPNWQILNGLIRFSCEHLSIEIDEPSNNKLWKIE